MVPGLLTSLFGPQTLHPGLSSPPGKSGQESTGSGSAGSTGELVVGASVGALVGRTGARVGGETGAAVGAGVSGLDVAQPQATLISEGKIPHVPNGIIAVIVAVSSKTPHGVAGYPGKEKISSGFVIHFPSPQALQLSAGMTGQGISAEEATRNAEKVSVRKIMVIVRFNS